MAVGSTKYIPTSLIDHLLPANKEESEEVKVFEERLTELKRLKDKAQALFDFFNSGLLNDILVKQNNGNKKDLSDKIELTI